MEESGEIYAVTVVYTGHFTIGAKNKREAAVLAASLPPVMADFPSGYVKVNWGYDDSAEYNLKNLIHEIKQ